jgi:hypothetical protein
MKKQNQNKLAFNKAAVTELNFEQLKRVNGGISGYDIDTNPNSGCICDPLLTKITVIKQNQI